MTKFMTQTEYAKHRGISQPRVSKLIKTGQIPASAMKRISGKKLIDMDKADQALAENLDRVHNPNPEPRRRGSKKKKPTPPEMKKVIDEAGLQDLSMAEAQRLQANYKAALLKLELDQKSDLLVEKEKVREEAFEAARIVRDGIMNIPDRLSAELASCTDVHTVSMKLTDAFNEVLGDLSE